MLGLEIAVLLGAVLLVGGLISDRTRIPTPMVLLAIGAALGFVPMLAGVVTLPPEIVLFLFLPILLYRESLTTSLHQIRENLRVIVLLAVGLVLATALVIALVARAFGWDWSSALVLGAVLAPTDATAVAALVGRALPRRARTVLRAESLINDATALALYSVALSALMAGRTVQGLEISLRFVYALGVGAALGIVIAGLIFLLRRITRTTVLDVSLTVLSPFLLFLPAELLGASAVVSVVVGGLMLSQASVGAPPAGGGRPQRFLAIGLSGAEARRQGRDFWTVTTYLVNGVLFILIGLQMRPAIMTIASDGWRSAIAICLICAVTVILIRPIWTNLTTFLIRLIDRRPIQLTRRASFRERLPVSWASFRGAVSLAAALALPVLNDAKEPLPHRDVIIAATFTVVVVTVYLQGLTMPLIVRAARLPPDTAATDETFLAKTEGTKAALAEVDAAADAAQVSPQTREEVRADFESKLASEQLDDDGERLREELHREFRMRQHLLAVKRQAVIELRREHRIDDEVNRTMQTRLDLEELRMQQQPDDD